MPTSDSEDYESADEGEHISPTGKKCRRKRTSSSNYSDNSVPDTKHQLQNKSEESLIEKRVSVDGWDDFEIDDSNENLPTKHTNPDEKTTELKSCSENDATGWEDFNDLGQENLLENENKAKQHSTTDIEAKAVLDRLSAATINDNPQSGWGWGGWSVGTLLNTATAGITTLTTHVSQGITNVLETGIGAPNPEELARTNLNTKSDDSNKIEDINGGNLIELAPESNKIPIDSAFPLGSIISGVTKFVENTGTKVITGGLDTLETIGKKTMEVLQDGDPGLAKKRAMFGLDSGDKPVLSQILKEAKAKADEEDQLREEKREARQVHYETLFDDYEGLVHLEALEMLSKQVNMRIEEQMRCANSEKRQEILETLQQVSELCEMPDSEDEEELSNEDHSSSSPESLQNKLQEATACPGLKLQFQPLVNQYSEVLDWLKCTKEEVAIKLVYKKAVGALAQSTALSVELYHKAAEMLLVKTRRSTADEVDALTTMTVILTRHISELATCFTEKLNSVSSEKEETNNFITNVFLEAGKSSSYIQNAFQLTLPILQIGAV